MCHGSCDINIKYIEVCGIYKITGVKIFYTKIQV